MHHFYGMPELDILDTKMERNIYSKNSNIAIKLVCPKVVAKHFMGKFASFFNHIFQAFYNSSAYFEEIEGGFLFFCEQPTDFALLFTPFSIRITKMINRTPLTNNYLISEELSEQFFPKEGWVLDFEFLNRDATEYFSLIHDFYVKIHEDIQVVLLTPHIYTTFTNYAAFKLYADLLATTYKQFI